MMFDDDEWCFLFGLLDYELQQKWLWGSKNYSHPDWIFGVMKDNYLLLTYSHSSLLC